MNIHFTDKRLFESLKENSLIRITVGSHAYGHNTKDSDIDYLYIYVKPPKLRNSFLWEHHQLQYKEDGIDHNFTDLQTFVRNIMTGDSTINFEALHSPEMREHPVLSFLYDRRFDFYGYNIAKSYLGLATRDLKQSWSCGKEDIIYNNDKIYHAVRGYYTANMIIEMEVYQNNFAFVDDTLYVNLLHIKNKASNTYLDEAYHSYRRQIQEKRNKAGKMLEQGKINRVMTLKHMATLDTLINNVIELTDNVKGKDFWVSKKPFYEVLENGVQY